MKPKLLALLLILVFGAGKLPFEHALFLEQRAAKFHLAEVNLGVRQQVGQLSFIAALSGFRAIVADLLFIQGHTAWQRTEWGRLNLLMNTACALQPRCTMFWETGAWHMAWNASVAARNNMSQPREALRIKAEREYFRLGEDFLVRGTEFNPEKFALWDRLGMFYKEKTKDYAKAAAAYDRGAQTEDALPFARRFAAYMVAKIPGREREAHERLQSLYNMGKDEQLPTLLKELHRLDEFLGIPASQRAYKPSTEQAP